MADDDAKKLSAPDKKELDRLVAKYGRKAIVTTADKIRYTKRAGRPRDDDKRAELWEHIEWIEQHADWLRSKGHKHGAYQSAVNDRFRMVTPYDEQTESALKKFAKRIKNKRDEWSRVERLIKAGRKDPRPLRKPKRPRT